MFSANVALSSAPLLARRSKPSAGVLRCEAATLRRATAPKRPPAAARRLNMFARPAPGERSVVLRLPDFDLSAISVGTWRLLGFGAVTAFCIWVHVASQQAADVRFLCACHSGLLRRR